MGVLAKVFLEHLILRNDEAVIIDTEAGVEHFGRGVDRFTDAILMVADPSYESIQLAGKISNMGKSFEKPVYIVLNNVDAQQRALMEDTIQNRDAIVAALPLDSEVLTAGLKGEALRKEVPEIQTILDTLSNQVL